MTEHYSMPIKIMCASNVFMHSCLNKYAHACKHMHVRICMHACKYALTPTLIYSYSHTHTRIHTFIQSFHACVNIQTQQTYVLQAKHLLFKYRREEGRKEKDESKTGRETD